MSCKTSHDIRHVTGYNLAGYANYVSNTQANAMFEDQAERNKGAADGAYVVLLAKEDIEAGREVRVDYDVGCTKRPFRDQLIAAGVAECACTHCGGQLGEARTTAAVARVGLVCDGGCERGFGAGDVRWSCGACDFDLCGECAGIELDAGGYRQRGGEYPG